MNLTPGHISRQCRKGDFKSVKVGNSYLISEEVVKRLPYKEFNPDELAHHYRLKQHLAIERNGYKLQILGILSPGDAASMVYAKTLQKACDFVGINFSLVEFDLKSFSERITQANEDPAIHGIFVFYPIFNDERDKEIKDLVAPQKDIEGLSSFWSKKMFANERFIDAAKKKKAVLPCTPLGILKTLIYVEYLEENTPRPFLGKKITIFNRSDVVGGPLAHMLKNDGATVYSFDVDGGFVMEGRKKEVPISREEALKQSDIVITGVPSRAFEKVRGEEIRQNATCLNFSFVANFEQCAKEKAGIYVPRVGPMTIAMCLRNAYRLYENYREEYDAHMEASFDWRKYGKLVELSDAS